MNRPIAGEDGCRSFLSLRKGDFQRSMISDEELDALRMKGTRVRVVRDADQTNDVRGVVVAWDERTVLIRKLNRKVVQFDRAYRYQPAEEPRIDPE